MSGFSSWNKKILSNIKPLNSSITTNLVGESLFIESSGSGGGTPPALTQAQFDSMLQAAEPSAFIKALQAAIINTAFDDPFYVYWSSSFANTLSTTVANVAIAPLKALNFNSYTLSNTPNTFSYSLSGDQITISTPGNYQFSGSFWSTVYNQNSSVQLDSSNRANLFFNNNFGSSNSQGFSYEPNADTAIVILSNITVLNSAASFSITNNSENGVQFGGWTLVKQ